MKSITIPLFADLNNDLMNTLDFFVKALIFYLVTVKVCHIRWNKRNGISEEDKFYSHMLWRKEIMQKRKGISKWGLYEEKW
jgi:hypothetical protein